MKLAICGPGRCGKDTVSMWLAMFTYLSYGGSTSEAAARLCFEALKAKYGYDSVDQAFEDRHNHREEWAELIWEHNQPDGMTLYRDMLPKTNILNGIRRASELQALQDTGMIDLTIWIDRLVPADPSCEITADNCDIVIRNHGTLQELHQRLERFARTIDIFDATATQEQGALPCKSAEDGS